MKLERLLSPDKIKGLELKNRVVMEALHHLYTPDGTCTERFKEYYYRRALGGVGLVIVGGCRFDDYGGSTAMMSLKSDDMIPGYKEFTDGMHERGAKVAVQLYHAGRYSRKKNVPEGKEALAPSAVYASYTHETPKEMTIDELKEIISNWADGALRAKKAGFDAVEIVTSAGYLIGQFLSSVTNLRTDEYGGSWENKTRFPKEVVAAVREAVGEDYPILMRISGNDFINGGNTNTEAISFCKLMEEAGVDALNVTGGWHETRIPQLPGNVPRGGYTYLAKTIKDAVSIPIIASNRITKPEDAENILALGRCDFIGIARPLVADPDWVKKAEEGRTDEIRGCVACNQGCLAKTFFGKPVECLVNGYAGREYLYKDREETSVKKDILVIGGGPAGCEFAIKAAELGHSVTLWEREKQLGGQLPIVAVPPGKQEFSNFTKYLEVMLRKNKVKIEYNKSVRPQDVPIGKFDEVIIATGTTPKTISLPIETDEIPVYTAADVLGGKYAVGKDVLIVGGGSVGCETAQYIVHQGAADEQQAFFLMTHQAESMERIHELMFNSDRNVTIVEIEKIGAGFEPGTGWPVMDDLKRMGVGLLSKSKLLSVGKEGANISITDKKDGSVKTAQIPCDTVILAVGSIPNNELYEALKDTLPNVHIIGDARNVGKVIDAIREADTLAVEI
ncbi:MAG: FAD-dependent oxidoreductase [Clostridioides sp.]|nr:FAD-dependent oxidoreductase [Clostridioides sp.]